MKNEEIKAAIEKVKANKFLPEFAKNKKIALLEKELTTEPEKSKNKLSKAEWELVVIDRFAIDNDMTTSDAQGVFEAQQAEMDKWYNEGKGAHSAAIHLEKISQSEPAPKSEPKAKSKRGPKPKVKPLKIDITKPVKFKKPLADEDPKTVYKVTNYNEGTGRVYITPIKDKDGIGEQLVDAADLKNVKEKKPKNKNTYKYKGKDVKDLDDKDCDEVIAAVKERREKAKKAEKKSKSRPVIEKVASPIVRGVKKAIENISAAELKDKPKTELSRVDKAIAATKRFLMDLKTILGEDFEKDTVDDELKELHALSKELHKKYGE